MVRRQGKSFWRCWSLEVSDAGRDTTLLDFLGHVFSYCVFLSVVVVFGLAGLLLLCSLLEAGGIVLVLKSPLSIKIGTLKKV
jgi:hypothetical protein